MKRFLLSIWRILPDWLQVVASALIRPRYQAATAAVVLNEQGQLLLCKHTYRRRNPWGLPGGGLKWGADPEEDVRRELYEETGLKAETARLLMIENSKFFHHLGLFYLCQGVSGSFVPSDEVASVRYFDLDDLPEFHAMQKKTMTLLVNALAREKDDHELA